MRASRRLVLGALLFVAVLLACHGRSLALEAPTEVQALLVSDLHFEPFWDPGKVASLEASPTSDWRGILQSAASPDRRQRFADLERKCHARGDDTSFALFESALKAMKARAGAARFVAVSGDLIAHGFDCKYKSVFPQATPEQYRAFVEKTIEFVTAELDHIAPPAPMYVALGNNDSDCGDYKLDENGPFLADIAPLLLRGAPRHERDEAIESFKKGGYYSVRLPAPIERTRLLVLNDVLLSPWHKSCSNMPDPDAGQAELEWLAQQLDRARTDREHVWVMGHIPPGVDAYSTLSHDVLGCSSKPPVMYLATEQLAQELTAAGSEIDVAIFAHAHTDEFKLLRPDSVPAGAGRTNGARSKGAAVAIKMVPSISPINGNNPAFVVAQVSPSTARIADYRVYAAKDPSGGAWGELYDFDRAYNQQSFSSNSVASILRGFSEDPGAKRAASRAYVQDFLTGRPDILLPLVWPKYVCTLSHDTGPGFTSCACGTTPAASTPAP